MGISSEFFLFKKDEDRFEALMKESCGGDFGNKKKRTQESSLL